MQPGGEGIETGNTLVDEGLRTSLVGYVRNVFDGNRRTLDRAEHRPRLPALGIIERHAERGREFAGPDRHLAIPVAHAMRTFPHPDPGKDFICSERSRERAGDELPKRDGACSVGAEDDGFRTEQQQDDEPVRGGIGQKGIGEGGAIGPPAAIANAINDALAEVGAEVDSTPITARKLLARIMAAREGAGGVPA